MNVLRWPEKMPEGGLLSPAPLRTRTANAT
ncbi:hypothetical protein OOOCML_11270 [Cupriavidus necator H16]